ncbi:DUF262 domain-containing protein [Alkalibacterium kapii]|uniref:GmrSD restriction endonucleases N-terminal domain-containing protein n=1 Tax=Alkalibacterium kapii TaxID=426704 RepID=A0A511AR85_9LACT|nr:DUF262 domain-containing protein [Alkalibacterium kapii]GEK90720.1 hypothetical protein AKA01nite_03420 [Alkalibacterium kapii]
MANYNVNNTTVNSLLSLIDEKRIAIPEIQRPFVWKSAKVRDLLDSLYNDYPVGYIITWRNPDARLKNGELSEGKTILIDGQQRVTALMTAISGQKVVDKKYNKKKIPIAFDPINEIFEVSNPAIRKDKHWIPDISYIFSEDFYLFEFVEDYCEKNSEIDRNTLSKILHKLESIKHSSMGVIEFSHIEVVADIYNDQNDEQVTPADVKTCYLENRQPIEKAFVYLEDDHFDHRGIGSRQPRHN